MRPIALAAVGFFAATLACTAAPERPPHRAFAAPEDAVQALSAAARKDNLDELLAIFGPEGKDLIASSDPLTTRRNRQIFVAAFAERWQLVEHGANGRVLVIGNEGWPFPVPLVKDGEGWRFDTAAGMEEVLARRIGRNELAAIRICRTYVRAQQLYAERGHDGESAGLYAKAFRSDAGRQNGLYWAAGRDQKRSPLGDLVAHAGEEGRAVGQDRAGSSPFHGYFFKILTAQGSSATGGAKDYVSDGRMSGGFALVAWPAQYDVTGIMTFVVNQDGIVHEKDLGAQTDAAARTLTLYDPDASWTPVQ